MTDKDIAKQKFDLLMRSIEKAKQENDETLDELKAAAFEVLLLHPGSSHDEWAAALVQQCGTELIDVYGRDPKKIYASIAELWHTSYRDENSGLEYKFETWAEAFATEASVQMYYDLLNINNE